MGRTIVENYEIMLLERQPENPEDNPEGAKYHLIIAIEGEEYAIDILPSMQLR